MRGTALVLPKSRFFRLVGAFLPALWVIFARFCLRQRKMMV